MKKHFLIVLCFVFFNSVLHAQVLKTKDVPKDAISQFKEKNPSSKASKWEMDDNQYVATFKEDKAMAKSYFTSSGEWIKTTIEVEKEDLPTNILRHVKKTYPAYSDIDNIYFLKQEEEKDSYIIDVIVQSQNIISTIKYTVTGKFISENKRELPKEVVTSNKSDSKKMTADDRPLKKKSVKPKKLPPVEPDLIPEEKVPEAVKKTFKKRFMNASDVKWYYNTNDSFYRLTCVIRDAETEGFISVGGSWISTITVIEADKLPSALYKSIDVFYSNYKIDKVKKEVRADKNDHFIIDVIEEQNKKSGHVTQMYLDKNGKIIKIVDPKIEEENKEPEMSDKEKKEQEKMEKEFKKDQKMKYKATNINESELPSGVGLWIAREYPEYVVKKAEYKSFDEFSEHGNIYKILIQRPGVNQPFATGYFTRNGKLLKVEDDFKVEDPKKEVKKEVSKAIKEAFKKDNPKVEDANWQEGENDTWIAVFDDRYFTNEATYSAAATWVQTLVIIDPEEKIPSTIRSLISKQHPEKSIRTCHMIKKPNQNPYYTVVLYDKKSKSTTELNFTSKGKLME
jgi:hypothetical protein